MPDTHLLDASPHVCQRALEALRNGVPNVDAVRVLGTNQSEVLDRFDALLGAVDELVGAGRQPEGLLFSGDFGSGKSHVLTHLMQRALDAGFVVSRIVVSKETPLYDINKVFRAMIREATVPGGRGQAIAELALRLRKDGRYDDFYRWTQSLPPLLAATVWLHERTNDVELQEKIREFWAGEKLGIGEIKAGLKANSGSKAFDVKTIPLRDLNPLRIPFAARLARAAGFRGWVVLLDELELIGRYSLLQRAKSYAELVRWMGLLDEQWPGVASVGAITADFDVRILRERQDIELLPAKVRAKGTESDLLTAARAETGMRFIERDAVQLEGPSEETLAESYEVIRTVHGRAYGWDPPAIAVGATSLRKTMRPFVRRWINEWDLHRIHGDVALHTEEEEIGIDYDEDADLELPMEETDLELPVEGADLDEG